MLMGCTECWFTQKQTKGSFPNTCQITIRIRSQQRYLTCSFLFYTVLLLFRMSCQKARKPQTTCESVRFISFNQLDKFNSTRTQFPLVYNYTSRVPIRYFLFYCFANSCEFRFQPKLSVMGNNSELILHSQMTYEL